MVAQPVQPVRTTRILAVLLAASLGLVVALVAGILVSTTGTSLAEAFLYGGGAFAVSMTLFLSAFSAVGLV
ncbi:hypothetical protein ACFQ8C_13320 [Streptomyces sp. NPDC056503]|uniref:hypothetical protein n=1 Tax=Streptomyces sp. NPDC056503 TaxID=3345842 RepID=UPI0036C99333